MDNMWGSHLALKQLIRKYQEGDKFCVINVYSKYTWIILLKDKKSKTTIKAFQIILKYLDGKPNKMWVNKANKF